MTSETAPPALSVKLTPEISVTVPLTNMATREKGQRSITKFRGGYEDPYSYLDQNLPPDTRLHGSGCIPIDYEKWTEMETLTALENKFVAISYKHDLRYPDRQKGDTYRAMRAPPLVVDEVLKCMSSRELNVDKYWHDGGEALWKDKLPTCRGSYPYLLNGGKVVIVPPFCNRNMVDVRSWCPYNYPEAARGMLVMSRYKIVEVDGKRILKRRRKAGVPSVGWGDVNRVWLLAEAFCGALRGEAYISPRSLVRLQSLHDEITFVMEGLAMLFFRKSRKPALDILRSIQELKIIQKDIKEYISIMTNKEVRKDGLRLSNYFVERMAIAGSSYEADRTLLGALTTFLLEQKFGLGVAPQDALAELEYSDDPFVTCLAVASVGNAAFPYGMTKAQAENTEILAALRSEITEHITLTEDAIRNQWPQPQAGRLCYTGTMTNSAWKNIFLKALDEIRCMNLERAQEKKILLDKVTKERRYLESKAFQSAQEKHQRYRFWKLIFNSRGSFSETKTNDPLFVLFTDYDFSDMPEVKHEDFSKRKEYQEAALGRLGRVQDLERLWFDRQKRYKLLVSGELPVAISPDSNFFVVYVLDTYGLDGFHMETVTALTKYDEPLLVLKRGNYLFELAKNYQGRVIRFDIRAAPVLQLVLAADSTTQGHLVAMRRVWSLNANSKVSIPPSRLKEIDQKRIPASEAKAMVRDEVLQLDRAIPMSLTEDAMSEYGPKYSIISTTDGNPVSPRSVISKSGNNVVGGDAAWIQISRSLFTPWVNSESQSSDENESDIPAESDTPGHSHQKKKKKHHHHHKKHHHKKQP